MSKRPSSISILGHEFEIRYEDMPEDNYGETEGWKRVIKINNKLRGDELYSTQLHEVLHAIFHVTGWSEKLGEQDEEGIVRALEHGLYPLLTFRKK